MALREDFDAEGTAIAAIATSTGATDSIQVAQAEGQPLLPPDNIDPEVPTTLTVAIEDGNIARLPADTDISRPQVNGTDLQFVQPDGTLVVIADGAVQGVTLFIGDIEVPADTVAALFETNGIKTALGPDGGDQGPAQDGHGRYEDGGARSVGDGGGQLSNLLGNTEFGGTGPFGAQLINENLPPQFQEDEILLRVSDEGLSEGNMDTDGSDDTTNAVTISGNLGISDPEDNALQFALGIPTAKFNGTIGPLTSGGVPITWVGVGSEELIGSANGVVIIRITVTEGRSADGVGDYTVTLSGPIDHLNDDRPGNEDDMQLVIDITATDSLGAPSTATLVLGIEDDAPVVKSVPAAANLLANGNFLGGDWPGAETWGNWDETPEGWTVKQVDDDGQARLERVASGYNGATSSNGAPMVDLEATPGNVEISQTVAGLTHGQIYTLSFEMGESLDRDGLLEVFWNGTSVGTFDPASGLMQLVTLELVAIAGDNTLTFREIGTDNDNSGTYLANVSLQAANRFAVDEDGLPAGEEGGDGDAHGGTTSAAGSLYIAWGADRGDIADANGRQDGAMAGSTNNADLTGRAVYFASNSVTWVGSADPLLSRGEEIIFRLDDSGTTLIGETASGRTVITVTLSDEDGGSFSFVLSDVLDHPISGTEDDIDLRFEFTARDFDGDSTGGSFTITVDDDTPVASWTGAEALSEDRNADGVFVEAVRTGQFNFDPGADGAAVTDVVYRHGAEVEDGDSDGWNPSAFKSGGVAIVSATAIDDDGVITVTGMAGNVQVYTLVVQPDGSYVFTLKAPMDHPDAGETGAADPLRLVFDFQVTDGDGDKTAAFNEGVLQIDIHDDAPVASWMGAEALSEDRDAEGVFVEAVRTGQFNFAPGADGAAVTDVVYRHGAEVGDGDSDDWSSSAFKSGGVAIVSGTTVDDDGVITVTGMAGNVEVYTLVVQPDGSYVFTLKAPMDHPDAGETGAADPLRLVFDFQVTDGDGDKTAAFNEGVLQIDIHDDAPVISQTAGTVVDERDLDNAVEWGSGDVINNIIDALSGGTTAASGSLADAVHFGADGPAAGGGFTFNDDTSALEGQNLASKGDALAFETIEIGGHKLILGYVSDIANIGAIFNVLENTLNGTPSTPGEVLAAFLATISGGDFRLVFSLRTEEDGDYTFRLFDQLDHVQPDNDGSLTIDFSSLFGARDGDGDEIDLPAGTFTVQVADDGPLAVDDDPVSVSEDGGIGGNVMDNDIEGADGAVLTKVTFDGGASWHDISGERIPVPGVGVYTFDPAGNWTFTPAADFNGQAGFAYIITDGDGDESDPATQAITVDPVNDAPIVDLNGPGIDGNDVVRPAVEQMPQWILSDATISDVDSDTLQSMTVTLTERPDGDDMEKLSLNPSATNALTLAGLSWGYNATTGVLTVTGPASITIYQTIMKGVVYEYTGDDPSTGDRSVTVVVSDGADNSASQTATIPLQPSNDAPQLDGTLAATVDEGAVHTFNLSELGYLDPDDDLSGVVFHVSGVTNGVIKNGGAPATSFTALEVQQGLITFTHDGSDGTTATFQVEVEDGNEDGSPRDSGTFEFNVNPVNDAPSGTDTTVTVLEDGSHQFAVEDFGFTDANDAPANSLAGVRITTLPSAGNLTLNGIAVTAGQLILTADIVAGLLVFAPAADANGSGYASFTFQVEDDGGTANGGVNLDPSANTLTIDVTPINDAPIITSAATGSQDENTATTNVVYQVDATDADNDSLTYTLIGADAELFYISSTGAVTFRTSPDFEAPGDVGGDNVYDITVRVSDGVALTTKDVQITVTDVAESAPPTVNEATSADGRYAFTHNGMSPNAINFNVASLFSGGGTNTYSFSDVHKTDSDSWLSKGATVTGNPDSFGFLDFDGDAGLYIYRVTATDSAGNTQSSYAAFSAIDGNAYTITSNGNSSGSGLKWVNDHGSDGDLIVIDHNLNDRLEAGGGHDVVIGSTRGEDVDGGSGDDAIYGMGGNDTLSGGGGGLFTSDNDFIDGGDGDDIIYGGSVGSNQLFTGDDVLLGGSGNDTIRAGDGNDILVGGTGDDILYGEIGHDLLIGGQGSDTLTGGNGNDTFKWEADDLAGGAVDFIADFDTGFGGDILDLSELLAGISGNKADHVRFQYSGGQTELVSDTGAPPSVNGDVTLQVNLTGTWVDVATIKDTGSNLRDSSDTIRLILDDLVVTHEI
jgi:T1SS-143 domain-containing protein